MNSSNVSDSKNNNSKRNSSDSSRNSSYTNNLIRKDNAMKKSKGSGRVNPNRPLLPAENQK
jgi:hypothetical protein